MSRRQQGAAILMAMLTVALVTVMAMAIMWQVWRSYEVEVSQRTRVQSAWVLNGALDWARLILREDARQGGPDALSEPWAVPLAPARLSDFLAAERGQTLVGDDKDESEEAFLAGAIEDLQARLNLRNLIEGDRVSVAAWDTFARLFAHLQLPQDELARLGQALLAASRSGVIRPGEWRPLWPQSVEDLRWLGVSARSLSVLRPYVCMLPVATPVNLNTASVPVLMAVLPGLDEAQAQDLVLARSKKRLNVIADVKEQIGSDNIVLDAKWHSVSSRYFDVVGQLRVGQAVVQERSLIQREGLRVQALRRQRELLSVLPKPDAASATALPANLQ